MPRIEKAHEEWVYVQILLERLCTKTQALHQGNKSIEDYFKEIGILMKRLNMDEDEENTIGKFLHGLNINEAKHVEMQELSRYGEISLSCR